MSNESGLLPLGQKLVVLTGRWLARWVAGWVAGSSGNNANSASVEVEVEVEAELGNSSCISLKPVAA